MAHTKRLSLQADLKSLHAIRRFVEDAARALAVAPPAVLDVVVAVDEAVTNIIVHGYRRSEGPIAIEVAREGQNLVVRLWDDADPFDPASVGAMEPGSPLARDLPGGFGIPLIRKMMDVVEHRVTEAGGNELILTKQDAIL